MEKTTSASETKFVAISKIVVAFVVGVSLIIVAVILAKGDYGRSDVGCAVVTGGVGPSANIMSENTAMDVTMMNGPTRMGVQRASYDFASNTVLIVPPANMSGYQDASIAVDYDRNLLVIRSHPQRACFLSTLDQETATAVDLFFQHRREEMIIDVTEMREDEKNYQRLGEIPAGYVSTVNGPIINGLCSGSVSYWTEPAPRQEGGRKKRSFGVPIRFCLWEWCLDFTI